MNYEVSVQPNYSPGPQGSGVRIHEVVTADNGRKSEFWIWVPADQVDGLIADLQAAKAKI